MKIVFVFALLALATAQIGGREKKASKTAGYVDVKFCDLFKNPDKYNNKTIHSSAISENFLHAGMLGHDDCPVTHSHDTSTQGSFQDYDENAPEFKEFMKAVRGDGPYSLSSLASFTRTRRNRTVLETVVDTRF
jgi:hypothetical protein